MAAPGPFRAAAFSMRTNGTNAMRPEERIASPAGSKAGGLRWRPQFTYPECSGSQTWPLLSCTFRSAHALYLTEQDTRAYTCWTADP